MFGRFGRATFGTSILTLLWFLGFEGLRAKGCATMLKGKKRKRELFLARERAKELLLAKNKQEALEFLEQAVQEFPIDAEIRLRYATILLAFRPDDVAAEAAKAAELGFDDPRILVGAGHRLLFGGDIEAARSCAERAAELAQPGFVLMPSLASLKGLVAALSGEYDDAEKELRLAIDGDPTHASFAGDLAVFLAEHGRLNEAVEVLDEALKHAKEKDKLEQMRVRMVKELSSS
jgi:Flp pilus assembly protein TadD